MATRYYIGTDGDFAAAANWSDTTAPSSWSSSDVIVIADSSDNIDTNLDQGAITATGLKLIIEDTFTGTLGVASSKAFLVLNVAEAHIHFPTANQTSAAGSSLILLDCDGATTEVNIYGSATTSSLTNLPPIHVKNAGASSALNVLSGVVGSGITVAAEASTWADVNVGVSGGGSTDAIVTLGDGLTLGDVAVASGTVVNRGSNVTTATVESGTYTPYGGATHATVRINGGVCVYNSDGTITTAHVIGALDLSQDARDLTITNTNLYNGATLNLERPGTVTFTNAPVIKYPAATDDVSIIGRGYTIDVEAS